MLCGLTMRLSLNWPRNSQKTPITSSTTGSTPVSSALIRPPAVYATDWRSRPANCQRRNKIRLHTTDSLRRCIYTRVARAPFADRDGETKRPELYSLPLAGYAVVCVSFCFFRCRAVSDHEYQTP